MKIPIFLSSDDNYAPFVATTMASICYNTRSFIDFFILDGGISEFNKRQIGQLRKAFKNFRLEFIKINMDELSRRVDSKRLHEEYWAVSTYSRFLIPALKPSLHKAIYLDVDIIALGDIVELYNKDLADYALAAAQDQGFPGVLSKIKTQMELPDDHDYFNAGVLLMDIQKWRYNNIAPQLFEIEKKYNDKHLNLDQDVLNKYFCNNYKKLDAKYNVQTGAYQELASNIPVIVRHFTTPWKPWNNFIYQNKPIKNFNDFWFFASLTPFYTGLQQSFAGTMLVNHKHEQVEVIRNIKKPTAMILAELRKKINAKHIN